MTRESRDAEWARLRSERAAARAALVRSLGAIEERARDPFRLKEHMRRHPALVAGIATGAGALLVRLLLGGRGPDAPAAPRPPEPRDRGEAPDFVGTLRDVALRAATPWLTRFVEEHLAPQAGEDAPAATNGTEHERPTV